MGLNLVLPEVAGVFALPERCGDCFSGNNTFFLSFSDSLTDKCQTRGLEATRGPLHN